MKSLKLTQQAVAVLFFVFLFHSIHAQIFVKWDAAGTDSGMSWTDAHTDLQSAIARATPSDQIWVAQGSYKPASGSDREATFSIPSGVEVYGGFTGTESLLAERDYANNMTILSGDIGMAGVNTDNSYTIVLFFQVSSSTILDGFMLEDGHATGIDTRTRSGAAIFINGASVGVSSDPQVRNCIFMDNTSFSGGGAVYIDGSSSGSAAPTFDNCLFNMNDTSADGGAIYNSGISNGTCTPSFIGCTFLNNNSQGSGGAIFNHGGTGYSSPTFKKCNFENNKAEGNGGAMYNLGNNGNSSPNYYNCRFYKNEGFAAGAIYNLGSSGGNSSPNVINCTFVANEATGSGGTGGAIYNNASDGGSSSPLISNCLIWGNIAPWGSHVLRNVHGTPIISYSIVDVADCNALNSGEGSDVTCNLGMLYNTDPLFVNQAGGNLRLDTGSPAINKGDNDEVTQSEDLDCNQRIQESFVDMGAYESAHGTLPVELVDFRAHFEKGQVELNWITLSEENNDYFTVERSADGVTYEKISILRGAGTSSSPHTYKSIDRNPIPGINYYRLQQTDFDGKFSFSDIQVIKVTEGRVVAYPNPVSDHLHLSFSKFNTDQAEYTIFNIYGKHIHSGQLEVNQNVSTINLSEVARFTPGTYILEVWSAENGRFTHKFEKIGD